MRARRFATLALLALLLAAPGPPARATGDDGTADSRFGVVMMVVCGLAIKASSVALVPWSGVAVITCLAGLIDAAIDSDRVDPPPPTP
jgi:hypothetical protein